MQRVGSRTKAELTVPLSLLLLVTVLVIPTYATTGVVSLPADAGSPMQLEFSDFAGLTANGQLLSIDFVFSVPVQAAEAFARSQLSFVTIPIDPGSTEDRHLVFG